MDEFCYTCGLTLTQDEADQGFVCTACATTETITVTVPADMGLFQRIALVAGLHEAAREITERFVRELATTQKGA